MAGLDVGMEVAWGRGELVLVPRDGESTCSGRMMENVSNKTWRMLSPLPASFVPMMREITSRLFGTKIGSWHAKIVYVCVIVFIMRALV